MESELINVECPEIKNLLYKSSLIYQSIKNKNLTSSMLHDYMNDFKALDKKLRLKLYSLEHGIPNIYTDDDIDCMFLDFKLCYLD